MLQRCTTTLQCKSLRVVLVAGLALFARAAWAGEYETLKAIPYVERSGKLLLADIYVPKSEGAVPGILVVHGGAWRMGDKGQLAPYAQQLAASGFAAVAVDYRLAPEHVFPAQIEDCKSAVRFMRRNARQYKINPERIGAIGYSAGGHLAALLGTTDASCGLEGPDANGTDTRVQCVVAGGAPCDFTTIPPELTALSYWLGGTRAERQQEYERASPLSFVTRDDPPMLFFHGTADADIVFEFMGPKTTIAKLKEAAVPCQLLMLDGANHMTAAASPRAGEAAIKFFNEHLKTSKAPAAATK